jgi:hypothetical protein
MWTTQPEPSLSELLSDPIFHLLLRRDGVEVDNLLALVDRVRDSLLERTRSEAL